MIKKPYIIGSLVIVAVFGFFFATTGTSQDMSIQSLYEHAERLWASSGHADATAEAFVHWDEDDPQVVPGRCSKCHSTTGAVNFLTTGTPGDVPVGTTVECEVCHTNPEAGTLRDHTDVVFPSGVTVEGLGPEALCMECHQGRASKDSVDSAIASADPEDDDTPSSSLRFINIHYYAAAADQFGTVVRAGYEYDDKMYDARFAHVTGYNACVTCHNPHSLEVELGPCNTCHSTWSMTGSSGVSDPKDIRYYGSFVDYDGDGDMAEGIYYEIEDMIAKLYTTMQAYANDVIMNPIGYDSHTYPYFFHDTNGNGTIEESEASYGNRYTAFTSRLLRAAYNYQVALKDPNAYAHGGKYVIQLLYDSMADLNSALDNPVSMAGMHRGDEGHFDGSTEAWRHWDEDEFLVSTRCAKCHSATGLQAFVTEGTIAEDQPAANGMLCTTCHFNGPPSMTRLGPVRFPSGEEEDMGDNSNYCLQCHQGRSSMFTVQGALASDGPYSFINIHYYPNAAILFGTEVKGGFEYAGKLYAGQKTFANHMGKFDTCIECHMGTKSDAKATDYTGATHSVSAPNPADCVYCHGQDVAQPKPGADPDKFEFTGIRPGSIPDYDGDGITSESIQSELQGLEKDLFKYLQAAGNRAGTPLIYDSHAYPYFFNDTNGNGTSDPGEAIYPNRYQFPTGKMLKAAYNYQMSKKAPSGYAHNSLYIAQVLVDSIVDLGGDASKYGWR